MQSGYSKYTTFSGNGGNEYINYIIRGIKAIIPSHCARNDVHHNWTKAAFGRPRHLECSPASATTRVLEIDQTTLRWSIPISSSSKKLVKCESIFYQNLGYANGKNLFITVIVSHEIKSNGNRV